MAQSCAAVVRVLPCLALRIVRYLSYPELCLLAQPFYLVFDLLFILGVR